MPAFDLHKYAVLPDFSNYFGSLTPTVRFHFTLNLLATKLQPEGLVGLSRCFEDDPRSISIDLACHFRRFPCAGSLISV